MKQTKYNLTIFACFWGYITQAITVNFPPLLFVIFINELSIPIGLVTSLITITFIIQLLIDLFLSRAITNSNVKAFAIFGQIAAAIGLLGLAFLPDLFNNKFVGIVICALFYSTGSGVVEVVGSPIVENCPTKNKSATMSLLHSFYCWGSAFTVLFSTLFFVGVGTNCWRILSALWAIVPLSDAIIMCFMPIPKIEGTTAKTSTQLLKSKTFYIMFIMMFLGGAAELAVSQWASTFAETGLNISKTAGDLAGPFIFAILMGCGRVIFSALGEKIRLINYMLVSTIGLAVGFALAAFSTIPTISFIGIALCGLSVAIFWPGTLSLAASHYGSSASLFGLLAFAGDFGCTIGPLTVGLISQQFNNQLSTGLAFSLIFPIGIFITVLILKFKRRIV